MFYGNVSCETPKHKLLRTAQDNSGSNGYSLKANYNAGLVKSAGQNFTSSSSAQLRLGLYPTLSEHNPMRFNPVYLVLGLLSVVYTAPVDLGSDLGSPSNFEKPLRARMEVERKRIHAQFTGKYAEQDFSQESSRPPAIVQELVHEGLAKLFPELTSDNEWMIEFGNDFVSNGWNPNTRGLRLT
ncbi:hypothetical protein EV368DRAFT_61430 [Lentinula lateritia]|nr:hypothetical protein EV368DRAFT_61430 [Lentinula lateritia]